MNKKVTPAISVYVGLAEYNNIENAKYMEKAQSLGIKDVFTSYHIPEALNNNNNGENFEAQFKGLLKIAEKLNMKLIVDLSKKAYESFEITKQIGALRLDYGFSKEEIVKLSYGNCKIELNASTIKKDYLDELVKMGLNTSNVRMSYNFYPKKYTALSYRQMLERNKWFFEYGLEKMAYIPSNNMKRPPMYEGLPSIEETRDMPVKYAARLLAQAGIDVIGIGDAYASSDELEELASLNTEIALIPIEICDNLSDEEMELLFTLNNSRTDQGVYMIRSSKKSKTMIEPINVKKITPYDVCIDNALYKRYCGEVSIALKEMEKSERVNVVGRVPYYGRVIVDNLKPGTTFKFIKEGILKNNE